MVVIGYPINVMVHHDVGDYWQDGFVLVSFSFALSMGGFISHFWRGYRLAFCLAIAAITFLPMGLTLRDPATGALAPLYVLFPFYLCFVVVAYLGGIRQGAHPLERIEVVFPVCPSPNSEARLAPRISGQYRTLTLHQPARDERTTEGE